ncbi:MULTISPECIES: 23S rRNA (uracil(1939)-C(5))-methyltransferase RlmD [unclassified Acinetobacter]|uniref:23S rRNA (uracil(1939)-C(5))-methyltransferase RlmD n=1 Tax=unclassified Acinetobacter TaxID=196816 RepID=UPI0035B9054A
MTKKHFHSKTTTKNHRGHSRTHQHHQVQKNIENKTEILTITGFSHEGRGIARYDEQHEKQGKKVFVRYALPDEQVQVLIQREHKRFDEAEMQQLHSKPSPHRRTPICVHFGECGGCALQHIDMKQQLILKQQALASHLSHFAQIENTEWLPAMTNPEMAYRRCSRVSIQYTASGAEMGFRAYKSNDVIAIEACPILHQDIQKHWQALSACLNHLPQTKAIGHIELVAADNTVALLIRHITDLNAQSLNLLQDFCEKRDWQLFLQGEKKQQAQLIYKSAAQDNLYYALPEFDIKLYFQPQDFIQVNGTLNRQMIQQAIDLLDLKQGEKVLDLFCGLGNFSLPLAKAVGATGRVFAVEGVADMVQRGQYNAKANQIENIEFFQQDLSQDFSQATWAKHGVDAILLDPPRAGADFVMSYIGHFQASRIVYISCDPATLARDSKSLNDLGYTLQKVGIMDMFSHTEHIESIALFVKNDLENAD